MEDHRRADGASSEVEAARTAGLARALRAREEVDEAAAGIMMGDDDDDPVAMWVLVRSMNVIDKQFDDSRSVERVDFRPSGRQLQDDF